MSKILDFYNGKISNQEGLYFDDIMNFNHAKLEINHCYIQWLFPLREPSLAVPDSPVITDEEIDVFASNWKYTEEMKDKIQLRLKVFQDFNKMVLFYGLKAYLVADADARKVEISKNPHTFYAKANNWLTPRNHNFLRLTRILSSLQLLGDSSSPKMLYKCLCEIYEDNKTIIGPLTKQFWDETMEKEEC